MSKFPNYQQTEAKDCGPTCIKITGDVKKNKVLINIEVIFNNSIKILKMKKYILLSILIFYISCKKKVKQQYTIKATITGVKDSTKVLLFNMLNYKVLDSTKIINNKITFKGRIKEPILVSLFVSNIEVPFWLENADITLNSSKEKLLKVNQKINKYIKGSATNSIALTYQTLISPIQKRKFKAIRQKKISDKEYYKFNDTIAKKTHQFFLAHPNNYLAVYKMYRLRDDLKKKELKKYYNLLSSKMKASYFGKLLNEYTSINPIKEGDFFADIEGKTLKGKVIKLSDYKGKVILLDFWAGWCPPCIKQVKEILPKLQEKYKNKNFQIVSFSFDFDKKMWENAVNHLKITWPDFSNLTKIDNNPVAIKYAINAIPVSFIIDKDGVVIKRVTSDDDLEKELDKVLLNH